MSKILGKRIDALLAATDLQGDEIVPLLQNGKARRTTQGELLIRQVAAGETGYEVLDDGGDSRVLIGLDSAGLGFLELDKLGLKNSLTRDLSFSGTCVAVYNPEDPTAPFYVPLMAWDQPTLADLSEDFGITFQYQDVLTHANGPMGGALPHGTLPANWDIGSSTGDWQVLSGKVFDDIDTSTPLEVYHHAFLYTDIDEVAQEFLFETEVDSNTFSNGSIQPMKGGLFLKSLATSEVLLFGVEKLATWVATPTYRELQFVVDRLNADGSLISRIAAAPLRVPSGSGTQIFVLARNGRVRMYGPGLTPLALDLDGVVIPDEYQIGLYSGVPPLSTAGGQLRFRSFVRFAKPPNLTLGAVAGELAWVAGDANPWRLTPRGLVNFAPELGELAVAECGSADGTVSVVVKAPRLGADSNISGFGVTGFGEFSFICGNVAGGDNPMLRSGQLMRITNATGAPDAEGTWEILVVEIDNFILLGSSGDISGQVAYSASWEIVGPAPDAYRTGLALRYQDARNHLRAELLFAGATADADGSLRLVQVVNGVETVLDSTPYAANDFVGTNSSNHKKLTALLDADTITLTVSASGGSLTEFASLAVTGVTRFQDRSVHGVYAGADPAYRRLEMTTFLFLPPSADAAETKLAQSRIEGGWSDGSQLINNVEDDGIQYSLAAGATSPAVQALNYQFTARSAVNGLRLTLRAINQDAPDDDVQMVLDVQLRGSSGERIGQLRTSGRLPEGDWGTLSFGGEGDFWGLTPAELLAVLTDAEFGVWLAVREVGGTTGGLVNLDSPRLTVY